MGAILRRELTLISARDSLCYPRFFLPSRRHLYYYLLYGLSTMMYNVALRLYRHVPDSASDRRF
jgi:hypothetical protein